MLFDSSFGMVYVEMNLYWNIPFLSLYKTGCTIPDNEKSAGK